MKIKTKLLLGLSMLLIITLLLIGIGWYQLLSTKQMASELKLNYESSSLSYQIQRKVKDEAISIRNIIAFSDKKLIQKELESLPKESDSVVQDILLLESMLISTEQRSLVEDLKATTQKYNDYLLEVAQLINEGNKDEATRLVMNNGYQLQGEYFQVISRITNAFEADMNSSLNIMEIDFREQMFTGSLFSLIAMIIGISFVFRSVWTIAIRLNTMSSNMRNIADGKADLTTRIEVKSNDEIDDVARSFNHMTASLEEQMNREQNLSKVNQELAWTKSNIAEITTELSGMHELESISQTFLSRVVPLVEACQAAFYIKDVDEQKGEPIFKLLASYAFKERKHLVNRFVLGEGLIGQAALEKTPILLTDVPADYASIRSALGEATPLNIYVLPVSYKGEVRAVVEIASFIRFNSTQQKLLEELVRNLAIILDSTIGRIELSKLLEESQVLMEELQTQSEELQSQQEELRATNEELEAQAQALRQSEEKLQYQQEELEQTNSELREKAEILEEQAKQLTLSSKYKSEFLANMSHELRTPLNSLLILSKLLFDNHDGNLSDKQVEFSKTIYSSGCDLLRIINDILDLAKVESGKMEVNSSPVYIKDLASFTEQSFRPIAFEKNIDFNIVVKEGLPSCINSDEQRLQQVLKNLLSNAFKFTRQGEITLEIGLFNESNRSTISFSITDTGIGIPKEKQEHIFQAFQQADGTTSRKYGGTGLGLSICREISSLLGGEIIVESEEGKGSTFTFYVGDYQESEKGKDSFSILDEVAVSLEPDDKVELVQDKSMNGLEGKNVLLVDDDVRNVFALTNVLEMYGMTVKFAENGMEGLKVLQEASNFDLVLMDIMMPEMDGYETMQRLREIPRYHNLPIIALTAKAMKEDRERCIHAGASDYIVKPVNPDQLISLIRVWLYPEAAKR